MCSLVLSYYSEECSVNSTHFWFVRWSENCLEEVDYSASYSFYGCFDHLFYTDMFLWLTTDIHCNLLSSQRSKLQTLQSHVSNTREYLLLKRQILSRALLYCFLEADLWVKHKHGFDSGLKMNSILGNDSLADFAFSLLVWKSEPSLWCTDLPSPAGRSRRPCGWCWGRGSPAEAPGPSSSSRSSTSPVSLTRGGQSATRTSAAPPWTSAAPPPGRHDDPGPPPQ